MIDGCKAPSHDEHGLQVCLDVHVVVGVHWYLLHEDGPLREGWLAGNGIIVASHYNHVLIGQVHGLRVHEVDLICLNLYRSPEIVINVILHKLLSEPFDSLKLASQASWRIEHPCLLLGLRSLLSLALNHYPILSH